MEKRQALPLEGSEPGRFSPLSFVRAKRGALAIMGELEDDKQSAFDAIIESIGPEFSYPDFDQQEAIDELDARYGFNPNPKPPRNETEEKPESSQGIKPSKAEMVLSLIEKNCSQLFTDEYDVPHVVITVKDHIEVLSIRSRRFKNWIVRTIYKEVMMVTDSQTIKDVIGVLSAKAEFEGDKDFESSGCLF